MSVLPRIILKKGREKSLSRGHPWIFSGAVEKKEGTISAGDPGEIFSHDGTFLGIGHLNPGSQIVFRLLSKKRGEDLEDLLRERITKAVAWREATLQGKTSAYRLINGEGDFLPGLILDRYGEILILQLLTAGMDRWRDLLVGLLAEIFRSPIIYERSDTASRKEEGLPESRGLLRGDRIPNLLEIQEYGARFLIDAGKGQKTGFYLDQRENRYSLKEKAEGKRILDGFSYSGGFSIHGGLGKAKELTLVESSAEALSMAEEHFKLNHLEALPHQMLRGDAFDILRTLEPGYDLIVLDPPPFAKKKGQVLHASRGYKDLNLQAFRLLREEGLLLTFSCSHHVSADLFQKIVFAAAVDAGKRVQVLSHLGHPVDHPFDLSHPEGEYLKGLLCRVY
jgi:23S rRNA (cytosine1962-C5)-methyltransferase